ASLRSRGSVKKSSTLRLLMRNSPLPGRLRTRATAGWRRPLPHQEPNVRAAPPCTYLMSRGAGGCGGVWTVTPADRPPYISSPDSLRRRVLVCSAIDVLLPWFQSPERSGSSLKGVGRRSEDRQRLGLLGLVRMLRA